MAGAVMITDRAAKKTRALLDGAAQGHGRRIKVVEGGCSG